MSNLCLPTCFAAAMRVTMNQCSTFLLSRLFAFTLHPNSPQIPCRKWPTWSTTKSQVSRSTRTKVKYRIFSLLVCLWKWKILRAVSFKSLWRIWPFELSLWKRVFHAPEPENFCRVLLTKKIKQKSEAEGKVSTKPIRRNLKYLEVRFTRLCIERYSPYQTLFFLVRSKNCCKFET